jgi:hypothetical protein
MPDTQSILTRHTPVICDLNGRHDLYGVVHKALRMAECQMLVRLGQFDFVHGNVSGLVEDLRGLLAMGAGHIAHEEAHIHTALEAKAPGGTRVLEGQHGSHRAQFAALEALLAELEMAEAVKRAAIGRRLYLSFSRFIAEDFEHMLEEETVTAPLLWSLFDDDGMRGIEHNIVSTIPPEKKIVFMRLMIPAANRDERFQLLAGMKMHAPKEAFTAVLEMAARPTLPADDMADLERRLALIQVVPN